MNTKESNKTLYIGDIHGQFEVISSLVKEYSINNTTLIQVGDFGAISKDCFGMKVFKCIKRLKNLDEKLRASNNKLLVIRGNHCDPLCNSSAWGDGLFSNIEFIKDYTVREIAGKSHLFVGGAISVDREMRRRNNWFFFEDEAVEFNLDKVPDNVDVLVTHCADSLLIGMTFSNIQHYIDEDYELFGDLCDEAQKMRAIREKCQPKDWVFGHYHIHAIADFEGTRIHCLDINEIKEI